MTYPGICQIGSYEMPNSLLLCALHFHSCFSFHLQKSHLANLKFVKSNAATHFNFILYASSQDPQVDIKFACAVYFDFGRMRL